MKHLGFADLLRTWMNRNFKSPEDVAREWGIERATVVKLLSGDLMPSEQQIPAIAKRMGYGETAVRDAMKPKASPAGDAFAQMLKSMGID